MEALELKARRESIGLTQAALATALGVPAPRISDFERGARPVPEAAEAVISEMEEFVQHVTDRMTENVADGQEKHDLEERVHDGVDVLTFASDEAFWEAAPWRSGTPSALHRAAAARARRQLVREGRASRIRDHSTVSTDKP